MPLNKETGAPEHPSIEQAKLVNGRLLSPEHQGWEPSPALPWEVSSTPNQLDPIEIVKKKRNDSQTVSVLGAFALNHSPKKTKDNTTYKQYLGTGGQGRVKFCQDQTGAWYAVKIIEAVIPNKSIHLEAYCLNKVGKLIAFYFRISPTSGNHLYYLIQTWIDGVILYDLISQAEKIKAFPFDDRMKEYKQLLDAVNKINSVGITHRDANEGNIIRKWGGQYELIDFGCAEIDSEKFSLADLNQVLGYMSTFFTEEEDDIFLKAFKKPNWPNEFYLTLSELKAGINVGLSAIEKSVYTQAPLITQGPNYSQAPTIKPLADQAHPSHNDLSLFLSTKL